MEPSLGFPASEPLSMVTVLRGHLQKMRPHSQSQGEDPKGRGRCADLNSALPHACFLPGPCRGCWVASNAISDVT